MKIGFVYAGQGSQVVGMGKDLYENYKEAKEVFDNNKLDFDFKTLSFEGPLETLSQTQYTQACMVAVAIAVTEVLKTKGVVPEMAAGLSLGEYSALYCAGVFTQQEVLDLVRFRGKAMEKAAVGKTSKMAAILGLHRELVKQSVEAASKFGTVVIANYNCPGQLVIGGEAKAVDKACELAKEAGAKRAIVLNVSGPFHTPLMEQASKDLKEIFEEIEFKGMSLPVVFNTTAKPLGEGETVAGLLEKQVKSSVYFEDSVRYMIDQGIDTFVEIGPGKVLSGFIKKISREVKLFQVEDAAGVQKLLEGLEESKQ